MNHAEEVLCAHLTEPESLDFLAHEGFSVPAKREVIPTELIANMVDWALRYYFNNGRVVAPSKKAFLETWGDQMEDAEVAIMDDTETDSIQWAVTQLRANFVHRQAHAFVGKFASSVAKADTDDKVAAVIQGSNDLFLLTQQITSSRNESDGIDGIDDAIRRYLQREGEDEVFGGMTFGMEEVDRATLGVHDGELAVFGAGTGVGKSWFGGKVALTEWERQRRCVLYTLENDLPMTFDRLVCMLAHVDYDRWQISELDDASMKRVHEAYERMKETDYAPIVIQPNKGERNAVAMTRRAIILGADSMVIDQMSFVEPLNTNSREARWARVSDTAHDIKEQISSGTEKLPCLLMNQIKREAFERAKKSGRLEKEDLAEATEIGRTADFIFTGYQSEDQMAVAELLLQMHKARRRKPRSWELAWRVGVGDIRVRREVPVGG